MSDNYEEALRARKEGEKHLESRNFEKSLKMLEISHRLYPNDEVKQLIQRVKELNNGKDARSGQSHGDELRGHQGSFFLLIKHEAYVCWERAIKLIERIEEKYFTPSFRPYARGLLAMSLFLLIYRLIFRQRLSLGSLPGDIYYSSSNMVVSAPIVSCLLVSLLLNAGLALLQRR
jgi:hypothetical protein